MAISKVVVVDGNNLTVRIDRGVAGRGITDVQPIEIDNALYLEFFFSDGTTETVGPVGTIQYIGQAPIVVNASTISLSTVPVNLGGTGQVTANAGFNALAPSQASNAGKYLKTDGTNAAWDVLDISTADITGVLPIANGGTNASTAAGARTNLNAANQDTTISAGTGLSGGGSLAADRTLSIANTAVTAASYGAASKTLTATVNAQGQLTALADTPIAIANTQISGLGTMSTQNANAVAITGGSITGITDLAVADGGTGASTAAGARTNLNAADQDVTISAGTGLSGGGSLAANRTLSIANTAVTAGSYGSASSTLSATVNAQGQLTALAATPIAIANTQVSGLGTASTLNAGVALGVATLDAGGTVPLSQIPASIQGGVSYQGSWNASTNTPTLTSSVGTKGYYYVVSVAGSTNLNGITDWLPGDWVIFNGSVWEQIDNTDTVQSVNGYVGAVVLNAADVGAPPTTRTITAGTGLSGGGDLSANRTIDIANTAVSAGSYGTASSVPSITVNAQGQLTAAANTTIAIANTQVSGLGTMSTQNANAVAITGGTATLTSLTVNDNTTLGSSNTDQVTFNARIASEFTPSTANTYDLGRNSHEWRNLYLTGTANISALTASSTVTLSGGTANGVSYLNASKELTTGSALTFDGTTFLVGSSTTNGYKMGVVTSSAASTLRNGFQVSDYATTDVNITLNNGVGGLFVGNGQSMVFGYNNTTEAMRLTDTGLGIGTSSPAEKLEVNGNILAGASAQIMTSSGAAQYGTRTANSVLFLTNNSEVMRLDSSGNLGIGTSSPQFPLDVQTTQSRFQVRDGVNTGGTSAGTGLVSINATATALDSFNYRATVHAFIVDSSEAMRLTSTGLGIGTSSPQGQLSLGSAAGGALGLTLDWTGAGGPYQVASFTANRSTGEVRIGATNAGGDFFNTFYTNNTERMRLDSSGNLGLGVTPSAWNASSKAFQIGTGASFENYAGQTNNLGYNWYRNTSNQLIYQATGSSSLFAMNSSGGFLWFTAPSGTAGDAISFTQAATLTADGNFLVGTTSTAGRITSVIGDGTAGSFTNSSASSNYTLQVNNNAASGTRRYINFAISGTATGEIYSTGTTTVYGTTSDYRLKTVIGPVADAGQRIDALQPVEYTWNADGSRTRGFLAHQFQEVYAGSVTGSKDAVDPDNNPVYQAMQASSSEVIADLVAEIKSLRQRLASLESK